MIGPRGPSGHPPGFAAARWAASALVASAVALAGVIATVRAQEPAAVSTLVRAQAPQRGVLPVRVQGYGVIQPAAAGVTTLSLPTDGRVLRVAVAPGDAVRSGQTLLELQRSALAGSAHAQALSALVLARQDRARLQRLLDQQLATNDQLAHADKALTDAQATLAALESEGGGSERQVLSAPCDGIVSTLGVAQGDRVPAGTALLSLTSVGGLIARVGIEPADRTRVRPGMGARIERLDGNPAALRATVLRVGHLLDSKTRLVDVELAIAGDVLQGEAVRATMTTGSLTGWVVPRAAVLDDEAGPYLFQASAGKAIRVTVQRLGEADEQVVVEGRIDPHLPLVVDGNYQLIDGAALRQADNAPAPPAR